jgi:hypothetical protein
MRIGGDGVAHDSRLVRQGFREQGLGSRVQSITPTRAAELLEANTTNRPVSKPVVRGFAEAMRGGEWLVTHQGDVRDGA